MPELANKTSSVTDAPLHRIEVTHAGDVGTAVLAGESIWPAGTSYCRLCSTKSPAGTPVT